jgi:hypothetical protein
MRTASRGAAETSYQRLPLRLVIAVVSCLGLAIPGWLYPALAGDSALAAAGYLPTPTLANATKCAGQKPWPIKLGANLNTATHQVYEHIALTKPNTICAATYYVYGVIITDDSPATPGTATVHGGLSASQYVAYPTSLNTRVGNITFEAYTGSGQGDISCQYWYWVANAFTQPQEGGTSKSTGANC